MRRRSRSRRPGQEAHPENAAGRPAAPTDQPADAPAPAPFDETDVDGGLTVEAFAGATVGDVIAATRAEPDEAEAPAPPSAASFEGDQGTLPLDLGTNGAEGEGAAAEGASGTASGAEPGPEPEPAAALEPPVADLPDGPPQPAPRRDVIALLEAGGDPQALLADLDARLAASPDDPVLLGERGVVLTTLLRYDAAEKDLRRALRLSPDEPAALYGTGLLLCRRARWREAIEPLRRAAELDPSGPGAHYFLGEAYNHVDQLPAALAAYEMAASLAPRNWRAHKGVGMVLDRMGRSQDAAAAHRRAREAHALVNAGAAGHYR